MAPPEGGRGLTLFTIGHGAGTAATFVERARCPGVLRIVDVRSAPGSRRHPQFGREAMRQWLQESGISYTWEPRLGGFRKARKDSPNTAWRNDSFRGYADHMDTAEFREALNVVLTAAASERTAVMCSETLWWRCHRRLIADAAVLLHAVTVLHIDGDGRTAPHRVTEGAVVEGSAVRYPAVSLSL